MVLNPGRTGGALEFHHVLRSSVHRIGTIYYTDPFIHLSITSCNGELSNIVTIEPNYFTLKAKEYESVNVRVKVPEDFTPGNYTGKVTVMKMVPFFRG